MSVVPIYHPHQAGSLDGNQHERLRARLGTAREVAIVALAAYIYFFVRGLIHSKESLAIDHARWLVGKEQMLGIFHEPAINEWVSRHTLVTDFLNNFYIFGHWPVVASTLVWLFAYHRDAFAKYRNAMLLSGMVGFAFFFLFPMAPPRLVPELGFIDTVTLHSDAYSVLQPPSLTNQFAAMPSLHVGWNLLMGIAIFRHTRFLAWKLFAVMMPLMMWFATIATANHYFLDGIVGSTLALTALAVVTRLFSQGDRVWVARPMVQERIGPTSPSRA